MIYSHRNGETEPPTIYEEYYWYQATEAEITHDGCYYIYPYFDEDDPARVAGNDGKPIADMDGRWWGPVTPPWEGE